MNPKLDILNDLEKRIKELKHATNVFCSHKNVQRQSGNDISGFISIKTTKEIMVFGRRWFGCGTHETQIPLCYDMVDVLEELLYKEIAALETEFERKLNNQ